MAWKLKKATPTSGTDASDQPAAASAGDQTIDYSAFVGATQDDADAAPDFLISRTDAADDAVEQFTLSKQNASKASDHDDWSLDAFAPYQPPAPFDFNEPVASAGLDAGNGSTHAGMLDLDAEPESLLGASHSEPTFLQSSPLEPSEFGVVDFDAAPAAEALPLQSPLEDESLATGFTLLPNRAADPDDDWQLGETGLSDSYEASGVSDEPTIMSGIGVPVHDDFAPSPTADAIPLTHVPAFDAPSEALSALDAPIPMPLPDMDFEDVPQLAAVPLATPDFDKTLLYGEAADSPDVAEAQPVHAAPLKPELVVRFGPFTASYPITDDDLVIGRPDPNTGASPNVSLEYEDAVSRRHARVYSDMGQIMLEDLGSKNGTLLNGSAVSPHQPVPLKPGDTIRVGERTEILFQQ